MKAKSNIVFSLFHLSLVSSHRLSSDSSSNNDPTQILDLTDPSFYQNSQSTQKENSGQILDLTDPSFYTNYAKDHPSYADPTTDDFPSVSSGGAIRPGSELSSNNKDTSHSGINNFKNEVSGSSLDSSSSPSAVNTNNQANPPASKTIPIVASIIGSLLCAGLIILGFLTYRSKKRRERKRLVMSGSEEIFQSVIVSPVDPEEDSWDTYLRHFDKRSATIARTKAKLTRGEVGVGAGNSQETISEFEDIDIEKGGLGMNYGEDSAIMSPLDDRTKKILGVSADGTQALISNSRTSLNSNVKDLLTPGSYMSKIGSLSTVATYPSSPSPLSTISESTTSDCDSGAVTKTEKIQEYEDEGEEDAMKQNETQINGASNLDETRDNDLLYDHVDDDELGYASQDDVQEGTIEEGEVSSEETNVFELDNEATL